MAAYVPGEQPAGGGYIKLNANENPYPPSPEVVRALLAEAWGSLNMYPDPMSNAVRDRLAKRFALSRESFVIGNGGDDILTIVTRCTLSTADTIAYPVPSYVLYPTLADLQDCRRLEIPYAPDFSIPKALFGNPAQLTILTNPNSTGPAVSTTEVKRLAESLKGVLIVDEAYVDFADENAMELTGKLPNLCILRSFSKSFSLAGMRVGYLAGPEALITEFMKAKDSYNVSRLSIVAAAAALDDYDYMLANAARIKATRENLRSAMTEMGFKVLPSQTNFLWATAPAPGAKAIYQALKERRILIRFWDREKLRDSVRITVGTAEQTNTLTDALREITGAANV